MFSPRHLWAVGGGLALLALLHTSAMQLPAAYTVLVAIVAASMLAFGNRYQILIYTILAVRVNLDMLWWAPRLGPFSVQQAISGLLSLLLAALALVHTRNLERHPHFPAVTLFAILGIWNTLNLDSALGKIEGASRFLTPILFAAATAELMTNRERRARTMAVAAVAHIPAIALAFYSLVRGQFGSFQDGFYRLHGPYQSFQNLAYAMLLSACLGIYFTAQLSTKPWQRIAAAAYAIASAIALYYTFSRTTAIGLMVFVTVFYSLRGRYRTVVVLLGVAALSLAQSRDLQDRYDDIVIATTSEDRDEALSAGSGRFALWTDAWERYTQKHPYYQIFGSGLQSDYLESRGRFDSHNEFIAVLYQLGIVGLACYLAVYATIVRIAWRLATRATDAWSRDYGKFMVALLGVVVTCNLLSNGFYGRPAPAWAFWAFVGVLFATNADEFTRQRRSNVSSRPSPHTEWSTNPTPRLPEKSVSKLS